MNSFVRKQHKLINRIKYYAYKLLFPISFIDIFKSSICIYTNVNFYDSPKIYNYLNDYNDLIIQSRELLIKLKEMTKWGLFSNSHILLKIKTEFLIKTINIYKNLILKFIRNYENKNNKNNKIYDISYGNYLKKDNILLFMNIYKTNDKYILINGNDISSVSEYYIDSLFSINFNISINHIKYPLYKCDQLLKSEIY
jgi:hypothetical protein